MIKRSNVVHPYGVISKRQIRISACYEVVEKPHVRCFEDYGCRLQIVAGKEGDAGLLDVDDTGVLGWGCGGIDAGQ
jgi:hypothetical protein